jgi:hypothetical protein
MKSRRDALRALAAGAMVPALQAQHRHSEELLQIAAPPKAKNLSTEDLESVTRVVDLIIPRTGTGGAADAGVPFYIDRLIGQRAGLGPRIQAGLAELKAAGFFTANPEEQIAQLKRLDAQSDPFFQLMKNLTIDGYYSSKEGLVHELGYHGNTYVREFVGCTHPEHGGGAGDAN